MTEHDLLQTLEVIKLQNQELLERVNRLELEIISHIQTRNQSSRHINEIHNNHMSESEINTKPTDDDSMESKYTVKNYDLITLERTQCYQKNETVNEYSKRFIRTHRDVKRTLANDVSIPAEHKKILFANKDKNGLHQYVRGLDVKLHIRILEIRPQNIKEAQDYATELEREDAITSEVDRRYWRGGNGRLNLVMGSTPARCNSRMEREP
ncbi:hypothetical protein M0802_015483 [Mischocyttarus mexicanus]|nr:hypothetical protein M0802_015483 [Mischocyttarus mexicanus]